MAVATAAGALAVGATASTLQTGTLVVRLVTDPTPSGATWKYSGAGSAFKLGATATDRTVALHRAPISSARPVDERGNRAP